uniref:Uncharacterized protein n=1 Tax=Heterorhabditis bacteriophora TaxID=37862 RepID=A0A1I7W6U8_HETBA
MHCLRGGDITLYILTQFYCRLGNILGISL